MEYVGIIANSLFKRPSVAVVTFPDLKDSKLKGFGLKIRVLFKSILALNILSICLFVTNRELISQRGVGQRGNRDF